MDADSIATNLFIIALLLMSNAFFVAAEFSMVSVRKTRIKELTKDGNFNAKIALETLQDLDRFVAAVQLGVTISSIGLGWVGESTLAAMLYPLFNFIPHQFQIIAVHSVATTCAFILITVLHVVIGELVPKSIALQYPEKTSLFIALPMKLISKVFDPFITMLNGFGHIILKVLRIPHASTSHLAHSIDELNMLINASYKEGVLNETEKDMLHNVFKFSDLTAKQVMIPRTDMACVPSDISYVELSKITSENQYTRYPVYEDNLDHITGIIHVKDLYVHSIKQDMIFSVKNLLRPVLMVPETITMDSLVREFKKCQGQMAIVIDEFGGTSGLITLEDVLEEIFGEVQDEFDGAEEEDIKEIAENTYLTNAMMRLDEINEFFHLELDDEDVDTIGGIAVKELGHIAQVGDKVKIANLDLTVKEIDGARITKLVIVKQELPQQNEGLDENRTSEG